MKANEILEMFMGTADGRIAIAKLEKRNNEEADATRTKLATELARVNKEDLSGVKQRSPGIQKRQDDLMKALEVVEERRQLLQRDIAHDGSERYRHELQRDRLEEALRETADPTILEVIDRLNGELLALRGWNIASSEEPTGTIDRSTGAEIMGRFSEAPSLKRRLQGLRDAIEAAKALQLKIIDDVPKCLAAIESDVPVIVMDEVGA